MHFKAVVASILVSVLITVSYAKASSEDKHEMEPLNHPAAEQNSDVIKSKGKSEEVNIALANTTMTTTNTPTTVGSTKITVGRHVPKKCRQHPERCKKGKKGERFASRERKREEKRKLKEEKKRRKDHKRAEKMAWKEKKDKERKERKNKKEEQEIQIEPEGLYTRTGPQKHIKPPNTEVLLKENMEAKSNSTFTVPPPKRDSSDEDSDIMYDYDSDESSESHASSEDDKKRGQWQSSRTYRKSCNVDSDCSPDQCCMNKVKGGKICNKKDYLREGRRCVDTCTCAGDLQCYRPNLRSALTGDLTPRRERIGRCTTKKEVNLNEGMVLPPPTDSTN